MEMVGIQKGRMLEERRVLEEGGRRGGGKRSASISVVWQVNRCSWVGRGERQ